MSRSSVFLMVVTFGFGCTSSQGIDPVHDNREKSEVAYAPVSSPAPLVVTPQVRLTEKQKRLLESSLPIDVRRVLESASEFRLAGEIMRTDAGVTYPQKETFEPNTIADLSTIEIRTKFLESFYADVSNGEEPANCWLPHHKLTARSGEATVDIEICFSCSRFRGDGPSGKFSGTFAHGASPKSEKLFNEVLVNQGRSLR